MFNKVRRKAFFSREKDDLRRFLDSFSDLICVRNCLKL